MRDESVADEAAGPRDDRAPDSCCAQTLLQSETGIPFEMPVA
jgi:hypothetical protein